MTPTGTLVWSQNDLANRALHVGHLAYAATTRAGIKASILGRVLPEHRGVVEAEAADAEWAARQLIGDWARLSSALEVSDPALAAAVEMAVWGPPRRLVTEERSAA